ncbi:MAG: WbqC family protein [Bacteroidota bacterium]
MKLGIMQPYFLPYLGYFQLIKAVDVFVIYDDVNYIKQGWVNRNRFSKGAEPCYITLELSGSSSFKKINEISVGHNKAKIVKTLNAYYKKATHFGETMDLAERILNFPEDNLSGFLSNSIKLICNELNIETNIRISSELTKNNELKAQEKIIHMCKLLNAGVYINAIGGQELYSKEAFALQGMELKFIQSKLSSYTQFSDIFIPGLSIIDVLMFNGKDKTKNQLNNYTLI